MGMLDSVFGFSPQVLAMRSERLELIAANLANADTPGYKARDMDFAAAMAELGAGGNGSGEMMRTNPRHMNAGGGNGMRAGAPVMFRMPSQPSMDGNTVETQREHAAFMDNAIRYQASLTLLDGRIKSTLKALRGE